MHSAFQMNSSIPIISNMHQKHFTVLFFFHSVYLPKTMTKQDFLSSHVPVLYRIMTISRSINAKAHERTAGQAKKITNATSSLELNHIIKLHKYCALSISTTVLIPSISTTIPYPYEQQTVNHHQCTNTWPTWTTKMGVGWSSVFQYACANSLKHWARGNETSTLTLKWEVITIILLR